MTARIRPLLAALVASLAFAAAPDPDSAPSDSSAADSSAGSLLGGQFTYAPPEGWSAKDPAAPDSDKATYLLLNEDNKQEALLLLEVWPKDGEIIPGTG